MGIIKAVNLIFDYIRHDEEEDKDEVSHALKGVSLDIKEGDFFAPKYTIESMPAVGESPMTMEVVDALPVVPESP